MATRMQQRRGTAAQWTAANPILAAGEIGFETDTSKFKMGNGSSTWTALTYFANASELAAIIDGAPAALNTLNELAEAMGDNPAFLTTIATNLSTHAAETTNVHGIVDTNTLATLTDVNAASSSASSALGVHAADTTLVHGIADTSLLATTANVEAAIQAASGALSTHAADTTEIHGIADTSLLATTADITTHNSDTSNVHGIVDTTVLVTQTQLTDAISGAEVNQSALAGVGIDWNSEDEQFDIDSTVATKTYADDAVTTHNSDTTNVHGIADTADLATKSYADTAEADAITAAGTAADTKISTAVAALTKSSVGLANVDNTSDANKPVSTATQTALDLKANLASPTFTGTVTSTGALVVEGNLTVSGTTTTVNAADLSITDPLIYLASNQYTEDVLDVGFMAATGAPGGTEASHLHSGFFRDASDSKKWKLVSNVPHPVNNVVDVTNATRETLVVGALEATTVTPSSGIVFSDGTQTKLGVPSVTTFASEVASSTTLAAGEADKFIPLNGAVVITLPATGYSTGQSIDFWQSTGTGASFASTNGVVGTPGYKFRTTNSVVTAMKTSAGWLIFGDLAL